MDIQKKVILSGMRPTGKLHIGHWVGALSNWVKLQDDYQCFFMIADWHALMSEYKNPQSTKDYILDNLSDWLSCGIDPKRSVIFIQSQIPEHLELYMVLSVLTPLGWLFRCPTFKEQLVQLKDKDINTYAFLGYPVLQTADILLYKAGYVPVGNDQLPHLELCREVVRRFNGLYSVKEDIFPEPQPLLTPISRLLGLDARKMSKSYNNFIALDEEENSIKDKVATMITDPERKLKTDKGHPDICNVFSYYKVFKPDMVNEVCDWCVNAKRGCRECKGLLAGVLNDFIAPLREKKKALLNDKAKLEDILNDGKNRANKVAKETMAKVKKVVGIL